MPSLRSEITKTYRRAMGAANAVKQATNPGGHEGPVLRGILDKLRSLSSDTKAEPSAPDPALAETTVAADPRQGRQYGNYRILRCLGAGGMGSVYLALDTRLGRHAALKFLSSRLQSDPEMLARLQHEARAASSLNHPNILTIYDISQEGGEPFIASEFVEGTTLRQALRRDLIEPGAALDIACQIASALVPAHAAGIVHRDLKPSNVMLRPDGFVKVIDFGLAKFAAGGYLAPFNEPLTTPGAIAGTVQYMSPEQARGEHVDQRSDVWSLGVILYEMLSKRHPFDGETESHIIVAILDHAVPPWKPPAGISSGVVRILECALSKNPGKRYQSAAEFHAALQELETPSQISRRRRLLSASSTRSKTTRRLPLWPLLISLAAAAGLAVWWFPFYGRELVQGPEWFNPAAIEQVTYRGDIGAATLSPDAKYVAFTTTGQDRDRIHLLNLASKTERLLHPFSGSILGLTFSPDSHSLYYTVHDARDLGRLYSTSLESAATLAAEATFVLNDVDGPVAFAPDGRQLVFRRRTDDSITNRNSIVLAPTDDTGDQRVIFNKVNTSIGSRIAWSPDGRTLALIVQKTDLQNTSKDTLTLLSPGGQIRKEFTSPFAAVSGPVWLDHGSLAGFVAAGKDGNQKQGALQELFVRGPKWRAMASPALRVNALSVSQDANTLSAVTVNQTHASLWVANSSSLAHLEKWPLESESLLSFAWSAAGGLLLSEQNASGISLWESDGPGKSRRLSQRADCSYQRPLAIPGTSLLVAISNCAGNGKNSNFWQLDALTGQSKQLTNGADFEQSADVSPDGKALFYTSWSSNTPSVVKLSLTDGKTTPLSHFQSRSPVVSPDGQMVACQIRENYTGLWRLALFRLNDGSLLRDIPQLPASAEMIVRWSPDGQSLDFFDPARGDSSIWRFSLSTSMPHLLIDSTGHPITDFHWSRDGTRLALLSALTSSDVVLLHKSTH